MAIMQHSQSQHHARHWKVWVTALAILGIAGLLFVRYADGTDLGVLSSFLAKFNPTSAANPFPIELQASLTNLQGKSYDVSNINIQAEAPCVFTKPPNNIDLEKKGGICTFSVDSANGKMSFSNGVVFDTDAVSVQIPAGKVYIGNLTSSGMSLLDVDGTIRIFQNNKWVSVPLQGQSVELSNVIGNMRIDGTTVTLNGQATGAKVEGGTGPGFKWGD